MVKEKDTYENMQGVPYVNMSLENYKQDLKAAFTEGIDTAISLKVGGIQPTLDEAFINFYNEATNA